METLAERNQRIERLERDRAKRQAQQFEPSEIAPGRGDMTRTSGFWGMEEMPMLLKLIGRGTVSYAKLFQTQPWIAAAVMRMLTWSVRVPLKVYRRTGDDSRERLREDEHPFAEAVIRPWDRGYQAALVQALLGPVLVHGNSALEVEEGAGGQIRFDAKDWRFTQPLMPFRGSLAGFKFDVDDPNLKREVSIDNCVHVAWWSPAPPLGTSPLQQLGITLSIEDAAQRYQQGLFKNGARPGSAVTASEEFLGLDKEERLAIMAQLREDLTALYTLPENAGRPALLPPGLDWKPVGSSAVEAELIDQRKVAREEVAAVYQIPAPMMGILDKATYSNIETQREMTYTDALGPPLVLIEQALNAQVLYGLMRETDVYCEFDFAGVLRGDRLKEMQALREAIGMALMTPNEGRQKINMPRSDDPGMDMFYIPTNNLAPVGSPPRPDQVTVTEPARQSKLIVLSREKNYEVPIHA
jgi:HK97 family phage portal protein